MADKKLSQQTAKNNITGDEFVHVVTVDEQADSTSSNKAKLKDLGLVTEASSKTGNAILLGGIVWRGTLDYHVWVKSFIINQVTYSIVESEVLTMSNGDGTHPRIDNFVVTIDPTANPVTAVLSIQEGTPAASPVQPTINLVTQAIISFRTVAALESTDPTTGQELIYDENVGAAGGEWDNSTLTTSGDLAVTTDPYNGTKSFLTPATASDAVAWTDTGTHDFISSSIFNFAWRVANGTGANKGKMQIKFINSSSSAYWLYNFQILGLKPSANWVVESIPLKKFQPTSKSATTYDRLEITFIDCPQIELDWINTQSDLDVPTVPTLEPTQTVDTGQVIILDNILGNYCNMFGANANTTYTYTKEVLGGFARVLINAASQPSVTSATLIKGTAFIIGTNMYMTVHENGNRAEYWFEQIAP